MYEAEYDGYIGGGCDYSAAETRGGRALRAPTNGRAVGFNGRATEYESGARTRDRI